MFRGPQRVPPLLAYHPRSSSPSSRVLLQPAAPPPQRGPEDSKQNQLGLLLAPNSSEWQGGAERDGSKRGVDVSVLALGGFQPQVPQEDTGKSEDGAQQETVPAIVAVRSPRGGGGENWGGEDNGGEHFTKVQKE